MKVPTPDISHLACRICGKHSMIWIDVNSRSVTCSLCKTRKANRRTKTIHTVDGARVFYAAPSGPKNVMRKSARVEARVYPHIIAALETAGIVGGQRIVDAGIDALREKLGLTFSV